MSDIELSKDDTGATRSARVGDIVTIKLDEIPTSGYQWEIDESGDGVLELRHDEYVPSSEGAVGGGGLREFRFEVVQPGRGELSLKLWRSWEGESSVKERFSTTIEAEA
jgi:inhibitor of cysteine peptidase